MRNFLRVSAALALLLLTASLAKKEEEKEEERFKEVPVVNTTTGLVSGIREESTKGKVFYSYRGIPYAQPPTGELRFKNPVKIEEWEGVKDGSKMPPVCPQCPTETVLMGRVTESIDVVGDEDCLFLNIFTPSPTTDFPHRPVMVFIHGGGYSNGGAIEYPPHVLLNEDVVLVVIQYRLGILGFLSTEDDEAPGNLGLKDQTMALTWVQNNIFKFGGDPVEVTLFGESAGSSSVHFQILSHRSLGLFKRAILQSGSAICPWSLGGAHAVVAESIGNFFNCSTEGGSQGLVSCLQGVAVKELVPTLYRFNVWHLSPLLLGPRVDQDFIYAEPEFLMRESRHKNIDLISGITEHEGAMVSMPMFASEALRSSLLHSFVMTGPVSLEFASGDISPVNQTVMIFDHYLKGLFLDEEHADNVTQMYGDRFFNMCHDLASSLHAKNVARMGRKTFRYELRHRGQQSLSDLFSLTLGKKWVSHGDDLFYLFTGGPLWKPLEKEEDLQLRDIMTKLWTNFAATGNPTPDDSLGFKWDPVGDNDFRYLSLKPSPAMEDDYRKETRDFWTSLPLKQNLILHSELVTNLTYLPKDDEEGDSVKPEEKASAKEGTEQKTEETPKEAIIKEMKKEEL